MGLIQRYSYVSSLVVLCSLLLKPSNSARLKSPRDPAWSIGTANWNEKINVTESYGACGSVVEDNSFAKMAAAVGHSLYDDGKGCGECYEVKCLQEAECSGNPITLFTTDESNQTSAKPDNFYMSADAFRALAKPGQADNFLKKQSIEIEYNSVTCPSDANITVFNVESESNPSYLSVSIEYAHDGDSKIEDVKVQESSISDEWLHMKLDRDVVWTLKSSSPLQAPLSFMLLDSNGKYLVANNVIPANWKAGNAYYSFFTQFK